MTQLALNDIIGMECRYIAEEAVAVHVIRVDTDVHNKGMQYILQ